MDSPVLKDNSLYKSLFPYICMVAVALAGNVGGAETAVLQSSEQELQFLVSIPDSPAELFQEVGPDSTVRLYTVTLIGLPPGATAEIVSVVGRQARATEHNSVPPVSGPGPLARLQKPFMVRGQRLVGIRVYPVTEQSIYREVQVSLRFGGGRAGVGVSVPDPFFGRLAEVAVVNHEQLSHWSTTEKPGYKFASSGLFGVTSDWYKITTNQSGLYKVTGAQLQRAGMILTGIPSEQIHLFNAGGRQLEVPNESPRPDFREVAILVEDGNDGVFDREDYILFYGEALNRWWYRPYDSVGFYHHHYATQNVYWFTASELIGTSGRRMASMAGAPDGSEDTVVTSFRRLVHSESDTLLSSDNTEHIRDYYRWYASDDMSQSVYIAASNVVVGPPAEVRVVAKLPWSTDSYTLRVAGVTAAKMSCDDSSCTFAVSSLREGLNQFNLNFNIGGSHRPFLDYIELAYSSDLAPQSDRLEFNLVSYDGRARVELIDDFSSVPLIVDIADGRQPRVLTGFTRAGGLLSFGLDMTPTRPNHFFATTLNRTLSPVAVEKSSPEDLRAGNAQADLIVVTPAAFTEAMQEYIDYRQNQRVRIVSTEDIYDNFAGGVFDPVAIRDFLKFAYETWPAPAPSVVLLVGDGNYDYLNLTGHDAPNHVPPLIHEYDQAFAYSDDNYVYFGEYGTLDGDSSYSPQVDRGLDMVSARWTVRNAGDIQTIIDKIKRYESPTNFGLWRTKIAMVADDEFAGNRTSELVHTGQTDTLGMYHLPPMFARDKVYSIEYPFVNNRKPEVNDAIVDAFNEGRLVINYVGHGNPGLWAHERIFTVADDLPRLANYDRLPLVVAASCAIGAYDEPEGQAMAEDLLTHTNGGAIAVISATRLVWSSPNKQFNQTVFDVLFSAPRLTICESMFTAKLLHQLWAGGPSTQTRNDRAFIYMGDPMLKLAQPNHVVNYDTAPDSLVALEPVAVTGEIVDEFGGLFRGDGRLDIRVYDSDQQKSYNSAQHGGTGGVIDYSVDGAAIYRGSASVSDGRFSFEFMPPLDIGFGGHRARITAYATLDSVDAAGIIDSVYVAESIAEVTDSVGPSIEYSFSGQSHFADGDHIQPGDTLRAVISDPSGINLTAGLGHGVTLELDGRSDRVLNLTAQFEYDTDDFTGGSVEYAPDSLEEGRHSFKIKAWDNANNSASVSFSAEMVAAGGPVVTELLNYPNPMQKTTRFSFYAARQLESFSLEIFTLSGRKIKSYSQNSLLPGYHDEIEWRGEDSGGDRVATGVYIYKATARPTDGRDEVEMFGKVVVIN
ncbi:MAG: type IX secretion system sortase PorU [candidate division Zixibacteria bacterium]|nr:type IX secretion system sortase PorU [candidate division Zixibacteria bacterium]MDH3936195.1 type IX secretion system sortase PorU [candidate division Zixibacteria bacterium]